MKKEDYVYSRLDDIKLGFAKDNIIEGTLVLEGGAFRGLYTAGVLDCLMDNDINLNNVIGISAGSLNGINYLGGNRGRTAYCLIKHRYDPRYLGAKAFKESGSIVNFKYIFEDYNKDQILNEERIFKGDRQLYVGCTSLDTGKTEFFQTNDRELFFKTVTASASMPVLSKAVIINGKKYLDGGCETKLPIRYAIENNFKKIIFVATRPLSYRRKLISPELRIEKIEYKNYPNFIKALQNANKRYNFDAEFLEQLSNSGGILTISPSKEVTVSRLEKDLEKMGDLYFLGYEDCKKMLPRIKEYLNI